jgi:tetratricopeptide (TPR) repeat protein
MNQTVCIRPWFRLPIMMISLASVLFLCSCSLPKIIILHDPLTTEEHITLGRIYQDQGKVDLAEQQFREALKKDPASVTSLLLLGDLSFQARKYKEAQQVYEKAIKLQPNNGDTYNNLSLVYLEQDIRLPDAEELVGKALTITPGHQAFYRDTLGMILMKQGRLSEAIQAFTMAIDQMPADNRAALGEAWTHLAQAYRANGEQEKADAAEKSAGACRVPK